MKKTMMLLLLAATILSAGAQQEKTAEKQEKLLEAKTRQMIQSLNITPEQEAKFTEIYRAYNEKMRSEWNRGNMQQKSDDVKQEANRLKQRLNNQKKALDVQLSYVDKLATVLNAEQLRKFFDTERKIQARVKSKRQGMRGHDKGHGQWRKDGRKGDAASRKARAAERRARHQQRSTERQTHTNGNVE